MQDHQKQAQAKVAQKHAEAKQEARPTTAARRDSTTEKARVVVREDDADAQAAGRPRRSTPGRSGTGGEDAFPAPSTPAARRKQRSGFFGDDRDTRQTLAQASRDLHQRTTGSALATSATKRSGIVSDVHPSEAVQGVKGVKSRLGTHVTVPVFGI